MSKILLIPSETTVENPWGDREFERVRSLALRSEHQLVCDADVADLIVFVGTATLDMWDLRTHSVRKQFPQKCFVLSTSDRFFPFLPGLYASVDRRFFDQDWCRPYCYTRVSCDESFEYCERPGGARHLFSFRGNVATHPVRADVMRLTHPSAVLTDTGARSYVAANRNVYREEIQQSQFVLCPRGAGVSSFRVFECLAMGRAPVIISDDWTPPLGPDWSQFSIRVREEQVDRIPELLEKKSHDAKNMGRLARAAWEHHFAPDAAFDSLVSQWLEMKSSERKGPGMRAYRHLLRPFFFKHCLLKRAVQLIRRFPSATNSSSSER